MPFRFDLSAEAFDYVCKADIVVNNAECGTLAVRTAVHINGCTGKSPRLNKYITVGSLPIEISMVNHPTVARRVGSKCCVSGAVNVILTLEYGFSRLCP